MVVLALIQYIANLARQSQMKAPSNARPANDGLFHRESEVD